MQITKQKGGILMRKKKLVTMIAALALTISSATMGALPVNAAENDDVKVMDCGWYTGDCRQCEKNKRNFH